MAEPADDEMHTPPREVSAELGHLESWQFINHGGFAVVYAADDPRHQRRVAIKVIKRPLGTAERERFRHETVALGRLSAHPNVVPIYQSGVTASGIGWIVMEFASGGSLSERIRSSGAMPTQDVARTVGAVAAALDAGHALGLVHGDVKPANVFMNQFDAVRLGDFGLAQAIKPTSRGSQPEAHAITPGYVAPEVSAGAPASAAADQWMLAVTACHLLIGRKPFRAGQLDPVNALVESITAATDGIHENSVDPLLLTSVLSRAFDPNPDRRFESCGDFARQLASALGRGSADLEDITISHIAPRKLPPTSRTLLVAGLVVGCIAALLAIVGSTSTTAVAPVTVVSVTVLPTTLGDVRAQPSGLFCRDIRAMGFSYPAAADYWQEQGQPERMDADRDGIPCETVYPSEDVIPYWRTRGVTPEIWRSTVYDLGPGLLCRHLAERGYNVHEVIDYYLNWGGPPNMDADGNGIPCETVYPDARDVWLDGVGD